MSKKFPDLKPIDTTELGESIEALAEMLKSMHVQQGIAALQDSNARLQRADEHAKWSHEEFLRGWDAFDEHKECAGTESEPFVAGFAEAYQWCEMCSHDPNEEREDLG